MLFSGCLKGEHCSRLFGKQSASVRLCRTHVHEVLSTCGEAIVGRWVMHMREGAALLAGGWYLVVGCWAFWALNGGRFAAIQNPK